MPLSKEEKAQRRAQAALEIGGVFHARGEANKTALEEARASLQADVIQGRKSVQTATSSGKKKLDTTGADWVERIEQAGEEALHNVKRAKKEEARGSSEVQPAGGAEEAAPEEPEEAAPEEPEEAAPEEDAVPAEFVPPLREADAAKLHRLKDLTFQIQALEGMNVREVADKGVHMFLHEKLAKQRRILLGGWSAGADYVDALEHEDRLFSCADYQAYCGYESYKAPLALLDGRVSALAALKQEEHVHRQDFEVAKDQAAEAMKELHELALGLQELASEAHKDLKATEYYPPFQTAKKEFVDKCLVLTHNDLISHGWIRECQQLTGLSSSDLGYSFIDRVPHCPLAHHIGRPSCLGWTSA